MAETDLFDRILASLHEAALDDARWPRASGLIGEACGSQGNILIYGDGRSPEEAALSFARFCYRGRRRVDRERLYLEGYFATDRIVPRVWALERGRLTALRDLYADRELKASRTYREAHPRLRTERAVLALLPGPGGSLVFWANADPVRPGGWDAAGAGTMRRLLPHVGQYVRVRQALVDAQALGASMGALLENSALGVVRLDRRGRIVEACDVALEVLRSGGALRDEGGFLRARARAEDDALRRLLARAMPPPGGRGASGSMTVGRPSAAANLVVHVVPAGHAGTDFRTRRVAALALLTDPARRPSVDPDLVGAALGLTPAESRVAVSLACGESPRAIAAATGRRETTVRWHIRRILAKTGLSRLSELPRLVLSLAGAPGRRR